MAFIPVYILILLFTIAVDYVVGIKLDSMTDNRKRRWFLTLSILGNVGILAVFKYFYFIEENLKTAAAFLDWNYSLSTLSIVLPIGLSFHTFQSLSYIIEVYRGNQKAERHFGIYALYVMYYPQLVAGPIERPQNLLHQLRTRHSLEYERVRDGLKLMLWGFFKKVAIADQVAITVDTVFDDPSGFSGLSLLVALVMFGVQIYCDFSGYSDIAIGASKIMGVDLMLNFRQPYLARSISEFWRRWHISLSTWFRDYLYIPLGGNRVSSWRWQINMLIVFLVSGLWHGASWAFVIWGGLHGLYVIGSTLTKRLRANVVRVTRAERYPIAVAISSTAMTFALVCFAWIFFRAKTLSQAMDIVVRLPDGLQQDLIAMLSADYAAAFLANVRLSKYTLAAICILIIVDILEEKKGLWVWLNNRPTVVRWATYYALGLWILVRFNSEAKQFIYFQF